MAALLWSVLLSLALTFIFSPFKRKDVVGRTTNSCPPTASGTDGNAFNLYSSLWFCSVIAQILVDLLFENKIKKGTVCCDYMQQGKEN